MSLLDRIEDSATDCSRRSVEDPKNYDALMDRAAEVVRGIENDAVRRESAAAVADLRAMKGDLAHLSSQAVTAIVANIALDRNGRARQIYLAETATIDELYAASRDSTDALVKGKAAKDARDARWANNFAVLLTHALRLLPVLLAAA